MISWIPFIILIGCLIWTFLHWPKEEDMAGHADAGRAKFREFLVQDIRAASQYCYWYLALIGVIAAIVAANKDYFAPVLKGHLWPFGLAFLAASLSLLFLPAGYKLDSVKILRFVWLRNVLCEQIVVIFTCYGIWEAFRAVT